MKEAVLQEYTINWPKLETFLSSKIPADMAYHYIQALEVICKAQPASPNIIARYLEHIIAGTTEEIADMKDVFADDLDQSMDGALIPINYRQWFEAFDTVFAYLDIKDEYTGILEHFAAQLKSALFIYATIDENSEQFALDCDPTSGLVVTISTLNTEDARQKLAAYKGCTDVIQVAIVSASPTDKALVGADLGLEEIL